MTYSPTPRQLSLLLERQANPRRGDPRLFALAAANVCSTDCLIWPYLKGKNGYGVVWFEGRLTTAHRVVCAKVYGPCPEGKECAHSCGNRICVNPSHLRWATSFENNRDKVGHGTYTQGEKHHSAKLSARDVEEIRERRGLELGKHLAARFGVTLSTISMIQHGRNWKAELPPKYEPSPRMKETRSKEHVAAMRRGHWGNGRLYTMDGATFDNIHAASKAVGVSRATIYNRVKSPNWPNWTIGSKP